VLQWYVLAQFKFIILHKMDSLKQRKELIFVRTLEVFAKKEERFSRNQADLRRMVLEKVVNIDMNVDSEICAL
jgi:hypothetical protein